MRAIVVACLVMLCGAGPARAWGEEGHAIIAEIAQRRLADPTRAAIDKLLGRGVSLASIASWGDDERSRDKRTTRWHFIDVPMAASGYDAARDCKPDPDEGDCALAAIAREQAVVACASRPAAERVRALKFLVHLVGDIHQPLHAIGEKKGGNDVRVAVVLRQGANRHDAFDANLHVVWDSALIQNVAWSWGGYVERLETGWLASNDLAAARRGTPVDWANESHKAAVEIFRGLPANAIIDDAYVAAVTPMLDRQLARGGLRLARLLDETFAAGRCPGR
ncbi:MAG TPA: S1/P1 nuclease [Vineibacter sp.]|nr:S1/P1 nuclease [Vineibacter sp.]